MEIKNIRENYEFNSQIIKYELLAGLPRLEQTIRGLEEAKEISRETLALEFNV
jgi:hypothetical protein